MIVINRIFKLNRLTVVVSLLFVLCFSVQSLTQYNGYFGKKTVVELFSTMYNPTFSNMPLIDDYLVYHRDGNRLEAKKDRLDFGFRLGVAHSFSSSFALGFEGGIDYFSIQRQELYSNINGNNIWHEALDIRQISFLPKLIFSGNGSLQPMGISHQLGFGFNRMNVVDREYIYKYGNSMSNQVFENDVLFDNINKAGYSKPKSFTLMYALNMRTPITKSLFFTYGLRYQLHFIPGRYYYPNGSSETELLAIDQEELSYLIKLRKRRNYLQAQIGIAFAF